MTHPIILADAERIASRVDLSPLRGESVMITGESGLIGTTLCAALERSEIDRLGRSWWPREREKYDYVIHAAGYSAPSKFMADPIKTVQVATEGLNDLFRHFLKPGGTLLFLSSSEIYSGANPPHKESDIGTATPEHPRASYIFGKLAGETICHVYRSQGVNAKVARVCLAYGPGTKRGDTRVLNQFVEQALTRGAITLSDTGRAKRAYCYVTDTVEMLLNILLHGTQPVYNVGNPEHVVEIRELAALIAGWTGAKPNRAVTEEVGDGPVAVCLDIDRYRLEFDPPAFVTLTDGLLRTIEYQRSLYEVS